MALLVIRSAINTLKSSSNEIGIQLTNSEIIAFDKKNFRIKNINEVSITLLKERASIDVEFQQYFFLPKTIKRYTGQTDLIKNEHRFFILTECDFQKKINIKDIRNFQGIINL